jgi:hypothetical protein
MKYLLNSFSHSQKKEKKKMKKKTILGTALTLTLIVLTVLMAVATSFAAPDPNKPLVTHYSSIAMVAIQLPTPSNATSPPAAPGTPSHPTSLVFVVLDHDKRSTFGAHDELYVALWVPQGNSYVPIAMISDNDVAGQDFKKTLYNNTFIWQANFENVIAVAGNELEIWTEKSSSGSTNGHWGWDEYGRYTWNSEDENTLTVNLTKSIVIKLPWNLFPSSVSFSKWGNQTFTLPPMTLTFREIGDPYYVDETAGGVPSGYTENVKIWRAPAFIECAIPTWIRFSNLQFIGKIGSRGIITYTPPS